MTADQITVLERLISAMPIACQYKPECVARCVENFVKGEFMIVAQTLKHKESAARAASSRGGKIGGGKVTRPLKDFPMSCTDLPMVPGKKEAPQAEFGSAWKDKECTGCHRVDCAVHGIFNWENGAFVRIRSDAEPAKRRRGTATPE
jgi:hypothetical protein